MPLLSGSQTVVNIVSSTLANNRAKKYRELHSRGIFYKINAD